MQKKAAQKMAVFSPGSEAPSLHIWGSVCMSFLPSPQLRQPVLRSLGTGLSLECLTQAQRVPPPPSPTSPPLHLGSVLLLWCLELNSVTRLTDTVLHDLGVVTSIDGVGKPAQAEL